MLFIVHAGYALIPIGFFGGLGAGLIWLAFALRRLWRRDFPRPLFITGEFVQMNPCAMIVATPDGIRHVVFVPPGSDGIAPGTRVSCLVFRKICYAFLTDSGLHRYENLDQVLGSEGATTTAMLGAGLPAAIASVPAVLAVERQGENPLWLLVGPVVWVAGWAAWSVAHRIHAGTMRTMLDDYTLFLEKAMHRTGVAVPVALLGAEHRRP